MLKDHHFVKKYKTFFRIFRKLLMSKSKDKWMSFMSHRLCRSLKGMVLFGQERTYFFFQFFLQYTSHSAYVATETELVGAKIDGLLPPNFL